MIRRSETLARIILVAVYIGAAILNAGAWFIG